MQGGSEFFGGLLLLFGFFTRPAALVTAIAMMVAIVSVHIGNGLFLSNNGYEFGLALLGISVSLLLRGAGSLSVDHLIGKPLPQKT